MLKISQEYLWDRKRVTYKEIVHVLVYFRIYSIVLKMSTSAREKYPWHRYKILHWKQINQINNAGLFQHIYSHRATILFKSVKFNSGLTSKVWLRVSFKVHIVQLTTWRQTTFLHSATGCKANVVLVWVPNMTVSQATHSICRFESKEAPPHPFCKMTSSDLQVISLRKTPPRQTLLPELVVLASLHNTQRWSALTSTTILSVSVQNRDWGCQIKQPDPSATTPLIGIPLLR